ncbi:hypothetical protein SDC9_134720 [bioreactor metagenome]|uniref:Uncharacterized protein n=1 Tax=bioreactor metagenome TaxID=1076179 RepID=A0A645DDP9_9ZZZZ
MPALSSDADNVFLLDYYFKDGISDELLPYSFNGVLKYMSADLPAGFSAEEAETVAYYKYTALDTSKNKIDFPFSSYALRIPDGYLASPGYAVYAFADGKTVKCHSVITGTDSKTMTFGAVAGADGYALVHLGGPAPIKQQAEPDEPEETGSPETGNSDNVPSTAGTDTKINNNTAPISKTAVIIIAIAGVTAVLEALLILKFKKPPKKT